MENEVIELPQIQPIYYNGQKVLSSNQLAALFKCRGASINEVFRRHKKEFVEGVDYFYLEKDELYIFKIQNGLLEENGVRGVAGVPSTEVNGVRGVADSLPPFSKTANAAYLWTQSGILKHATFYRTKRVKLIVRSFFLSYFGENCELDFAIGEPNPNCVYAMELDNNTVKIGRTETIDARSRQLENQLSCKVLRVYHTDFLPKSTAVKIETACCKVLNPFLARGKEFFNVSFEDACAIIDKCAFDFDAPQSTANDFSPREKVESLKFLIERCKDENLRDKLIKSAYEILIAR